MATDANTSTARDIYKWVIPRTNTRKQRFSCIFEGNARFWDVAPHYIEANDAFQMNRHYLNRVYSGVPNKRGGVRIIGGRLEMVQYNSNRGGGWNNRGGGLAELKNSRVLR